MAVQSTLTKNFLSILDCLESVVHSTIIVPTLVPITLSACVYVGKFFVWRSRSWFSVSWPLFPVGVHFEMTTSLSRIFAASCRHQA